MHNKNRTITESPNRSSNQQRTNNNRTTALDRTAVKATVRRAVLKCILLVPNLALDSTIAEAQKSIRQIPR